MSFSITSGDHERRKEHAYNSKFQKGYSRDLLAPDLKIYWLGTIKGCHRTRLQFSTLPYGLVVRIPGFHPGGPGSIPGVGTYFCLRREVKDVRTSSITIIVTGRDFVCSQGYIRCCILPMTLYFKEQFWNRFALMLCKFVLKRPQTVSCRVII